MGDAGKASYPLKIPGSREISFMKKDIGIVQNDYVLFTGLKTSAPIAFAALIKLSSQATKNQSSSLTSTKVARWSASRVRKP